MNGSLKHAIQESKNSAIDTALTKQNSPFIDGEVEGDAAEDVLAVLEVAEEADGDVEAGHDDHGGVEHAVPAPQILMGGYHTHIL